MFKMAYVYTTQISIITYIESLYGVKLIPSCAGGVGFDPPIYQMRTIFLIPFTLSVPIFNKKNHRTRTVGIFKLWPNFERLHPMRFFGENWHTKSN